MSATDADDPTRAVRLRESDEYFAPLAVDVDPRTFQLTATGLTITGSPNFATWEHVGRLLYRANETVQWAIGDWWIYGETTYGDRAKQVRERFAEQDDEQIDNFLRRCRNVGWVARAIEPSRRRDDLTFSHHEAVAALEPEHQDPLLDQAVHEGWTVRELRERVQRLREIAGVSPQAVEVVDESDPEIESDAVDADGGTNAGVGLDAPNDTGGVAKAEANVELVRPLSFRTRFHVRRMAKLLMEETQEGSDRAPEIRVALRVLRALQTLDDECACSAPDDCEHQREFKEAIARALAGYSATAGDTSGGHRTSQ